MILTYARANRKRRGPEDWNCATLFRTASEWLEDNEGQSFEDCDPVSGNHLEHPVTWRGRSQIPRREDEPVAFRVRMRSAELFEMRFA